MRVFGDQSFEFLVAAAELNILVSEQGVLFLEVSNLCFKEINLLGEVINTLLEMIWWWWTIQGDGAEDTFEEADGRGRTLPPGIEEFVL